MAKCFVVASFEVYDSGKEIGVVQNLESAHNYHRYPIAFQDTIEDTYTRARKTCEVLRAFYNSGKTLPKYSDQYIEGLSSCNKADEKYLSELRLFLQYGAPENCGQCRFFRGDRPCKRQLPTATPDPEDAGCVGGIRKEMEK